jgi:hypothetical protein
MIHGGLNLDFKTSNLGNQALIQHCCLRKDLFPIELTHNFWKNSKLEKLREINKQNVWDSGCSNCQSLESSNNLSFRTGMNDGLGIFGQTDLSGPARIDIMFDISCNLACRSCGPQSSTYWQHHLKENKLWKEPIFTPRKKSQVIDALSKLDLSNLKQLVFCGGETLLGQEYWDVADWLGNNVPQAREQLTLCFQTNGTQPIHPRNLNIIEKFHLVKLHISLDGIDKRFEYLRWPAQWNQVTDNISTIKETAPSNVMFVIEETISIFNLIYIDELKFWITNNFTTNRHGDVVNHSRHIAHGIFTLQHMTREYVDVIEQSPQKNLIPANWTEKPALIKDMISKIKKFDSIRNESFENVFPELSKLYARFL